MNNSKIRLDKLGVYNEEEWDVSLPTWRNQIKSFALGSCP
jgi:hypothetical protein